MKNATHFALVMLALLQGHAFAGDSSFEKPEGVVPSTGAGGAAFKTPQRVSVFAEEANATSVGKAPLTRKAFRELDPFLVDPIEYAGQTDSFSVSLAAYPHATKRTLKEGVAFSWRDGELFGLFAEHPVSHLEVGVLSAKDVSEEEKKKRREEVRNTVDVLAALWIYSADSVLDLKRNLDKPIAVLELVAPAGPTKESVFAFDAYVPVGKVEFGGGTKMGGKAERARFFAEFLSDDPEREILCLGSLADGVAYVRDRVGARDDPAALRALDEKARTASAERWTALGVDFSEPSGVVIAAPASAASASAASAPPPLDASAFSDPVAWSEVRKTSNKTVLRDRTSFREFDPLELTPIRYAQSMASFPTVGFRELADGVWFLLRDDSLVAAFLDHPPVQRDEQRLRNMNFSYEAALYLYPLDPMATHGMGAPLSQLNPLAVLTIENSSASPHPYFCAFTPEAHVNFGNCAKPETPRDAARFFFEFLCERPEADVFCLGKQMIDNGSIRSLRENRIMEIWEKHWDAGTETPPYSSIQEELRPMLDEAKADAPALAEKYGMVLWHAESDSHAEKDSHAESAEVAEFESHAESAESAEVSNPRELNEEKQREQNERFGQDLQQLIDEDEEE